MTEQLVRRAPLSSAIDLLLALDVVAVDILANKVRQFGGEWPVASLLPYNVMGGGGRQLLYDLDLLWERLRCLPPTPMWRLPTWVYLNSEPGIAHLAVEVTGGWDGQRFVTEIARGYSQAQVDAMLRWERDLLRTQWRTQEEP